LLKSQILVKNISESVKNIIQTVQKQGDKALCAYAARFDGIRLAPKDLKVSSAVLKGSLKQVSPAFIQVLKECSQSIRAFALAEKKAMTRDWKVRRGSIVVGQTIRPVDSVGVYIPGGRFPYPSTVLMTILPALVAGVKRVVMVTPPKNMTPEVLAAAAYAGCDTVYRVGGAGAIAALAYGTKTVEPVDFIVGPGNAFVTEAKRQVYGKVGIDSLAGPSEVVIIADKRTPIENILTDLSAQAEHDPDSRSILLSPDQSVLNAVRPRLDKTLAQRTELRKVKNLQEAADAANAIAAEHLEILVPDAEKLLPRIRHAGAIFLGPATTAVLGDYVAGPSHVLPTSGAARFASGLSVATFMKRSSITRFEGIASERAKWVAALGMARTEGMVNHADSLRCRGVAS